MTIKAADMDAVLAQMRALAAQARGIEQPQQAAAAGTGFSAALGEALNAVNNTQQQAGHLAAQFERGAQGVELADVMVAIQKANISFQAATQVRNRLVSAYQDIMNMPL